MVNLNLLLFPFLLFLSLLLLLSLGSYDVILDEAHFRDVLLQHCRPPPAKVGEGAG